MDIEKKITFNRNAVNRLTQSRKTDRPTDLGTEKNKNETELHKVMEHNDEGAYV